MNTNLISPIIRDITGKQAHDRDFFLAHKNLVGDIQGALHTHLHLLPHTVKWGTLEIFPFFPSNSATP